MVNDFRFLRLQIRYRLLGYFINHSDVVRLVLLDVGYDGLDPSSLPLHAFPEFVGFEFHVAEFYGGSVYRKHRGGGERCPDDNQDG